MTKLRRYSSLLLLTALALLLVGSATAGAGPKKGHTYSGKVHQFNGYKLPIRFTVSKRGGSVGNFTMADGPPTANSCASGPWGHPVSHSTPIGRSNRFKITMRLRDGKDNPNVGQVTVEGKFGLKGQFLGVVHTRTQSDSCNDDFLFAAYTG